MKSKDLQSLREEYGKSILHVKDMHEDPIVQFNLWMEAATAAQIPEPNAMSLATVDGFGKPTNRIVLLKSVNQDGFVFYTNYESKKARDMRYNAHVSAVFLWLGMERQIRIDGEVSKTSKSDSEAYFQSRPRESQLGAWASIQSEIVPNRAYLDTQMEKIEKKFKENNVLPLPPNWGGYCIKPHTIEFWQGRPNRLHDRLRYQRNQGSWNIDRLSP